MKCVTGVYEKLPLKELGKTIKVLADYGKLLSSNFVMKFVDCNLVSPSQTFPLISGGAVPQDRFNESKFWGFSHFDTLPESAKSLTNFITLSTPASNSQTSFDWKVFSIGRSVDITVKCEMEVLHTGMFLKTSDALNLAHF